MDGLSEEEIDALAQSFPDEESSMRLLAAAGFPSGRRPWASNSDQFWWNVSQDLAAGVLPDGRRKLLAAAARQRPGNPVLAAAAGTTAQSRPPTPGHTGYSLPPPGLFSSPTAGHSAPRSTGQLLRWPSLVLLATIVLGVVVAVGWVLAPWREVTGKEPDGVGVESTPTPQVGAGVEPTLTSQAVVEDTWTDYFRSHPNDRIDLDVAPSKDTAETRPGRVWDVQIQDGTLVVASGAAASSWRDVPTCARSQPTGAAVIAFGVRNEVCVRTDQGRVVRLLLQEKRDGWFGLVAQSYPAQG